MSEAAAPERVYRVFDHDQSRYIHGRRFIRGFLLPTLARVLRLTVEVQGMEAAIPKSGPAIVIMNHRGGIDPLLLMWKIRPRYLCTMSKVENFDLPIFNTLMRLWGAYPVLRGEVDRRALEFTLKLLAQGNLVLIAPEGTRQPDMIAAKDGLAYLATKANVPIVPVGFENTREFPANLKRYRPTHVTARFGKPFRFRTTGKRLPRETLSQMTREAMYQLAALVPEANRGVYGDLTLSTTDTLDFDL